MTETVWKREEAFTEVSDQVPLNESECPSVTVIANSFAWVEDRALKIKRLLFTKAEVPTRTRISKLEFQAQRH